MFKIVLSAVTFVLMMAAVLVIVNKSPQVRELSTCYEEVTAIYKEESLVTRRVYTKNATICERNKQQILRGMECFYREESRLEALDWELPVLKKAARLWARTGLEPEEVVKEHNENCGKEEETLIADYELDDLELKYKL